MHTRKLGLLAFAFALLAALSTPGVARADAVTQWSITATNAILAPPSPTAHASTLSFAMVQGAVYDAVNAIEGDRQPYLSKPDATPFDSKDAAVAAAAYNVLVALLPGPGDEPEGDLRRGPPGDSGRAGEGRWDRGR